MDQRPVLVIGDSHSLVFRGVDTIFPTRCLTPGVDVLQCADATAYGFGNPASPYLKLVEKAFHKDQYAAVVVSAGWIDCRSHIIPRAMEHGVSATAEAARVADRFLSAILRASRYGKSPLLFLSPPATTPHETHPKWNISGSVRLRNEVTAAFIDRMSAGAPVVDTFALTRGPDGSSLAESFFDTVHIRAALLPAIMQNLRSALRSLGVEWAEQGGGDFKIACKEVSPRTEARKEAPEEDRPPLARSA